ncbi:dUTP diphosphatase [Heyndrickxia acidiproducens]|uniref:dUTP diphosphatase n=1 Tax=Heyndrickxia acidiproducens TaxID=1121084 RepID=UPI00037F9009|nr:dUTP diphosphatase [Heyndrickxia acidiproducens]
MELNEWFLIQKQLDHYIESEHGLEKEDLFERKLLALLVETGELANETRCFKFWSQKGPSPREVILEEFVDGVHFILSLGLELGYDREALQLQSKQQEKNLTASFIAVYEAITALKASRSLPDYEKLLQQFFNTGAQLGFSIEDIQKAYMAKNEINYQRQQQGY